MTVKVTDAFGVTDTHKIRDTGGTAWVLDSYPCPIGCNGATNCCANYNLYGDPVGDYLYRIHYCTYTVAACSNSDYCQALLFSNLAAWGFSGKVVCGANNRPYIVLRNAYANITQVSRYVWGCK